MKMLFRENTYRCLVVTQSGFRGTGRNIYILPRPARSRYEAQRVALEKLSVTIRISWSNGGVGSGVWPNTLPSAISAPRPASTTRSPGEILAPALLLGSLIEPCQASGRGVAGKGGGGGGHA